MDQQTPRRLPDWGWVLAVLLFYPAGVFIAFGFARLLTWRWAVTLAVLSGLCLVGFVQAMEFADHMNIGTMLRLGMNYGGVLMFAGWTILIHDIGQRVNYWSPAMQRGWRWAKWLFVGITFLHFIPPGTYLFLLAWQRLTH